MRAARFAGLLGAGALLCAAPREGVAQDAAARPAALEPLTLPGDFPYSCEVGDPTFLRGFDLPRGSFVLVYKLGEFPLDDREISALFDGRGRVLALQDEATRRGGRPDYSYDSYSVGFEPDGTLSGLHMRGGETRSDSGTTRSVTLSNTRDQLTADQLVRARALAAWLEAHPCKGPPRSR
jgi:hypothetical protein